LGTACEQKEKQNRYHPKINPALPQNARESHAFLPTTKTLKSGGPTWVRIVHETPGETDVSISLRRCEVKQARDGRMAVPLAARLLNYELLDHT
jgi:hypothetical protein